MIPSVFALAAHAVREREQREKPIAEMSGQLERMQLQLEEIKTQLPFLEGALQTIAALLDNDLASARVLLDRLGALMATANDQFAVARPSTQDERA
jgi:hypothetical protein